MRLFGHCSVDLDADEVQCTITLDGDGAEPDSYPSSKSDDFRLEADGLRLYLQPRHGAQLSESSPALRGLVGCSSAEYAKKRVRIDGLAKGVSICVRADEGRYAELTLDEAVARKANHVLLNYTVWGR